jgi:hypothetical protein
MITGVFAMQTTMADLENGQVKMQSKRETIY